MSREYLNPPMTAIGSVINNLAEEMHDNAVKHGFYEDYLETHDYLEVNDQMWGCEVLQMNFTLAQLAKIASEVGEAVAAIQHGRPDELREELADIIIRTLDLGAFLEPRIGDCIMLKHETNKQRPYKHGKQC